MSDPESVDPTPPTTVPTGDPRVDPALAPLAAMDDAPVEEHPAIVEEVHRALRDILAEEQE
jgi:hypothetical protein